VTRRRLYVDIETRSRVDLKKYAVYRYVRCPDFRILMSGWRGEEDTATYPVEDLDTSLDILTTALRAGDVLVAHNAPFERVCFSTALGMDVGTYLDPEQWHDTAALAAEHGLPRSLDGAAKVLGCTPKDSAGTRLINLFCKPVAVGKRKGEWNGPDTHPEEWKQFLAYMCQDVDTLAEVDTAMGHDWPTPMELRVFHADQRINDRGIRIDAPLLREAMAAAEDNRMTQELQVQYLTGVANPNSNPQFLAWVQQAISPRVKNLQADTIERLLASPKLQPTHREILELRQELALVAHKKFGSALEMMCEDERLRGTLFFFGAHTGRWSGKGTQPQNLPREAFLDEEGEWDEPAQTNAILDLMLGEGASSLELKKLVRALFVGPFTVVDYAAIEARVIAWVAGERWAIQAFYDGRDIYVETAERMGGLTRKQGKIAVLALGYNGGPNSLRAMAGDGDYFDPSGNRVGGGSLGASSHETSRGASLIKDMSDEDLRTWLVDPWRRANPSIVRLWALLGDAVGDSAHGPVQVGEHLTVTREGDTVRIHLPSGRAITYHGMRWERYRIQDPKTKKWVAKQGWRYDDPKKPGMRIGTYGGRLAENVTQAIARDIMAEALVRLLDAGYEPVAHVHDEIIVEGRHPVATISKIMCEVPDWAVGLPIDGEGFTTERYRKG
jgi:DNA polymerase